MKPDLALLNGDDEVVLIGDAKWKLLSKDEIKLGILQPDLYQLIAYANRYDVKNLILYFPARQGLQKLHQLEVHGVHQCNVRIVCVDVLSNDVAIPEF
jgi:5-methylcytosine-specific restriction enzyme subunit McrC